MNLPKFDVFPRDEKKMMTGHNCRILKDGQEVQGLQTFSFEIKTGEIPVVKMSLLAEVELHGEATVNDTIMLVDHINEWETIEQCRACKATIRNKISYLDFFKLPRSSTHDCEIGLLGITELIGARRT